MKEKVSMFLPYEAPDGADFFREKYTYVCIINLLLSYIVCMSYHSIMYSYLTILYTYPILYLVPYTHSLIALYH